MFQDLDSPVMSATFGEVMCTTYKAFGAAGLITSGSGRDLDQVEAMNFPCFTDGTICAHGYCHILQISVPVHVGGVMVHPGDLLHGDRNGVTTIPERDRLRGRPGVCGVGCRGADRARLSEGEGINPKGYAEARKACKERIDALAKRLKGR